MSANCFSPADAYRTRPVRAHGVREVAGWRLKLYSIRYGPEPLDPALFEEGLTLAAAALPQPAVTEGRPGVGFALVHRGNGTTYFVLGWWARANEMPIRVFLRQHDTQAEWRPAAGDESFCVWDLQVLAFERDAYVATVLSSPETPDLEGYLARVLERD